MTNGDYLEFLRALPVADRKDRVPLGLTLAKDFTVGWTLRQRTLAPGEPYCSGFEPCVGWEKLPVDGASHEDGAKYAEWLSSSGRLPGARLCKEREWERAARGADERKYPYGEREPDARQACSWITYGRDTQKSGPCAAGTHPGSQSPFGAFDLSGKDAHGPPRADEQPARGPSWQPTRETTRSGSMTNTGLYSSGTRGSHRTSGSRTTIDPKESSVIPKNRPPTSAGEILLEEFLKPKGMTQVALALRMNVPAQRINTLISGKRGVTAETAILLSRVFGTSPEFWMNIQTSCDLFEAQRRLATG